MHKYEIVGCEVMPEMKLSAAADRAFFFAGVGGHLPQFVWAISQTDMYLLHKHTPAAECEDFEGDMEAAAEETPKAARNAAIN
jgi:hypothetical protein